MVTLRDLTPDEASAALGRIMDGYVEGRVQAGEDRAGARATADAQGAELFPGGRPAEGQHMMRVLEGDEEVGLVWMGRPLNGAPGTWHVYLVEVNEDRRGRGLGRATMAAAEEWARAHDATRVTLSVFGPNVVARSLYDAMGYQVMATSMFKDLD